MTTQDHVDRLATRTVTGNNTKVISLFANARQMWPECKQNVLAALKTEFDFGNIISDRESVFWGKSAAR